MLIKWTLIVLCVVFVVLIVILIFFAKKGNNTNIYINSSSSVENDISNTDIEYTDTYVNDYLGEIELVNTRNKYFVVSDILDSYTNNNFIINEMYMSKMETNINIFWIEGIKTDNNVLSNFIIVTDSAENMFSIIEEQYIIENGYDVSNFNTIDLNQIEYKEENKFTYKNIDDETYIKALLKDYMMKTLYNTQLGWELLDEEYRNEKFETFEKYDEFIEENRDVFMLYDAQNMKQRGDFDSYDEWYMYFVAVKLLELEEYAIETYSEYTKYLAIDTYGNNYIFYEETVMNYTLKLDLDT